MSRSTSAANSAMPYGDADIISMVVGANATDGLQRYRFVIEDGSDTGTYENALPIKYPAAGAARKSIVGLVGGFRMNAPAVGGYGTTSSLGTSSDPFVNKEVVPVTVRGSDLVEAAVAAGEEGAIARGDFIKTDASGKAVKWETAVITPDMTATLSADPTNTEVAAYIAEYVSEYSTAAQALEDQKIGIALGGPDADNLVRFIFI